MKYIVSHGLITHTALSAVIVNEKVLVLLLNQQRNAEHISNAVQFSLSSFLTKRAFLIVKSALAAIWWFTVNLYICLLSSFPKYIESNWKTPWCLYLKSYSQLFREEVEGEETS